MTRPVPPAASGVPGVPDSSASELHALYREGATAEPSLLLDRRILDAARAEVEAANAMKTRRPVPWWKAWLPVTSVIAVAVVGLSVTWRVIDEQERHLLEEMRAAPAADDKAGKAEKALAVEPAAEPRPSLNAQTQIQTQAPAAQKSRRAESATVRDQPMSAQEAETRPFLALPPPARSVAPAAPAASESLAAEQAVMNRRRAEIDELRERRDATAAAGVAASAAGRAAAAAGAAAAAATPDQWLADIRELRAAGRNAEAVQSLARFRARYPDFVLPDDLRSLK